MPPFDAVLFDNGETLFHRVDPIPSIVELAHACGVTISDADARETWSNVNRENLRGFAHRLERNASREGHRRYYIDRYRPLEEIAPGLAELFYARHKTSAETMVPYPDTRAVLTALRAHHVPLGIVSNTGWDISRGYARAGLEQMIDIWVLSWEHGTAKPDPELFLRACERLDVSPRRVLMVGNDAEADGGAAAVGATTLILPPVDPGEVRGLVSVLNLLGIPPAALEPTLAAPALSP